MYALFSSQRSVYWLNSHDPDFDAKAQDICRLYVQSPRGISRRNA